MLALLRITVRENVLRGFLLHSEEGGCKLCRNDNYVHFQVRCVGVDCCKLFIKERNMWWSPINEVGRCVWKHAGNCHQPDSWKCREFVKHWCWDVVVVEGDRQYSSRRREAVKELQRNLIEVGPLLSVKRIFILVDEEWFWKYVTDARGLCKTAT